ncbi:alanine aminotransferase 2-like [Leguminivora glycinivorella]|uniref:alanine aminotransferase 2-like n=1 Tax=Leguminivora glycinivorella TaxID=1035111 RepID=UPI00200DB85C|nr:alanine aminotransferase 2-like [Leguminivora glycinivorella]
MKQNVVKLEYAVRGPLVIRAAAIENELKKGANKPFKKVIRANLGDAHAMGAKPITFIRQILACASFPELIEKYDFPSDVKQRANELLDACGGRSVGAYSASYGIEIIRKDVAKYIEDRDGHPSNWEDVLITAGASMGIKSILNLFAPGNPPDGVLIPIPQYPLYSATLVEFGLEGVGYYLDEDKGWGLDMNELKGALEKSKKTCCVKCIVIINPGNPTGQVLREMGKPYTDEVELTSFMTISKGYMGECGLRGGWLEIVNMDKEVQTHLYKALSAMLCPTVLGQIATDAVARPPKQGEPSYDLYIKEKTAVLDSLKTRAKLVVDTFNSMEGFKCNPIQGAMYCFPRIQLPPKAIEAAKAEGKAADVFYAFSLLEETGICIVAGSGFKQRPGTYHFRTTILPQPELLNEMLTIFKEFHQKFTKKYS